MGRAWVPGLAAMVLVACGGGPASGVVDTGESEDLMLREVAGDMGGEDPGGRPDLSSKDSGPDEAGLLDPGEDGETTTGDPGGDPSDGGIEATIVPDGLDPGLDQTPEPGADPGEPSPGTPVNQVRDGDQSVPAVAARSGGGWWVAWQTRPTDDGNWQVAARCLDAAGEPESVEVRVSSQECVAARRPAVAIAADGGLWVVYEADGLDGSGSAVAVRRFPSCGEPPGPEWLANTFVDSFQGMPSLASWGLDGVVVAWHSACRADDSCQWLDGSWAGVGWRPVDSRGPVGTGERIANRFTTGDQMQPSVASLPDGRVLIAWAGAVDVPSVYDVFVNLFDVAGNRVGDDVRVNEGTADAQSMPRVAALAGGGAVVTWQDWDVAQTRSDVRGRLLDPAGMPLGSDLVIAADPEAQESSVAVCPGPGGGFVAAWRHRGGVGQPGSVRWRVFDATGRPVTEEATVDTGSGDVRDPAVAADDEGRVLLAWTGVDGSGSGVQAMVLPLQWTRTVLDGRRSSR